MKKTLTLLLLLTSIVAFTQNLATIDLKVQEASHKKAWIEWEEINPIYTTTENYTVEKFRIRYRELTDDSWSTKTKYYDYNQYPNVRTRLNNLIPNTKYEFQIKSFFTDSTNSSWSALSYLTTGDFCVNPTNFNAQAINPTKAQFTWENAKETSFFTRIKLREDYSGATWINAGGMGVNYPAITKYKNGLTPGTDYRAQARTWCGTTAGLPYKAGNWTTLVFWTQPLASARLGQFEDSKTLVRVTDLLGRECQISNNKTLIYIYSDGSVEKKRIQE